MIFESLTGVSIRYLFITGRSKEIINKGGEVISPFEIEEAIVTAAKDYVQVRSRCFYQTKPCGSTLPSHGSERFGFFHRP